MSLRAVLTASVVLAFAAPALAQEAPAAPAAPAAAEAADPVEAAFEAEAQAFQARMEAMGAEMQAAVTAAGADSAKATADLDAIVARYQPEADAFAASFEVFFAAKLAEAPEDQRAQMTQVGPMISGQIKGAPAMVKAQLLQAAAAPAAPASE